MELIVKKKPEVEEDLSDKQCLYVSVSAEDPHILDEYADYIVGTFL